MFEEDTVFSYCPRCGGEIYHEQEGDLCPACQKELSRWDRNTVEAVMEAFDSELGKYLSDDLRDTVWNEVAGRFCVQ